LAKSSLRYGSALLRVLFQMKGCVALQQTTQNPQQRPTARSMPSLLLVYEAAAKVQYRATNEWTMLALPLR
jgi:hypothetical protein